MFSAVQMPELRKELAHTMRAYAVHIWSDIAENNNLLLQVPTTASDLGLDLVDADDPRLKQHADRVARWLDASELFFVTSAMTDLAMQAGATVPEFNLHPEDMPAQTGFLLFEKHIPTEAGDVLGASWGIFAGGLWVQAYTDIATHLTATDASTQGMTELEWAETKNSWGRLVPATPTVSDPDNPYFGATLAMYLPLDDRPAVIEGWWEQLFRALITTWLLMGQEIVSSTPFLFRRQDLRRLARQDIHTPKVRTIELRHRKLPPRVEGDDDEGRVKRQVKVQHPVRGHWRQQWYPSQGRHKPIYIPWRIQGPEGAPLVHGDRVNVLKR